MFSLQIKYLGCVFKGLKEKTDNNTAGFRKKEKEHS